MQATSTSRIVEQHAPAVALESAEKAARRARRNAQVRIRFISRPGADQAPPPLARMLRGGRGGQVRLKLYLSYLWMQTDEHGVPLAFPAQVWAQLLGLPHPEGAGARRIHEAQGWLERNGFITVQSRPGHANRVTVLTETADQGPEPYLAPGAGARAQRNTSDIARHLYIQIPAAFWTNGYMALLSGAGLALYLILLDQYGPRQLDDNPHPVWFSPKTFRDRYALSEDTRAKGIDDLLELGLVSVTRQPINPDDFDLVRLRNAYALQPATLSTPAVRRTQPKPVLDHEARVAVGHEAEPVMTGEAVPEISHDGRPQARSEAASEEPPLVAADPYEETILSSDASWPIKAALIHEHRERVRKERLALAKLGLDEDAIVVPPSLRRAIRRSASLPDGDADRDAG